MNKLELTAIGVRDPSAIDSGSSPSPMAVGILSPTAIDSGSSPSSMAVVVVLPIALGLLDMVTFSRSQKNLGWVGSTLSRRHCNDDEIKRPGDERPKPVLTRGEPTVDTGRPGGGGNENGWGPGGPDEK